MTKLVDLSGSKFGNLLVIERVPRQPGDRHTKWSCLCQCGSTTVATYINLKTGNTTSCGCKKRPHGETSTPTHRCWSSMMRRCVWKSDSVRYQGIVPVCDRWKDYSLFVLDMGERPSINHTLDRIDNDRGYEPGNVRWATAKEQNRNKTNNHIVDINGEKKTISEWAELFGVTAPAVRSYKKRHGSLEHYPRYLEWAGSKGDAVVDYQKARHYLDKLIGVLEND